MNHMKRAARVVGGLSFFLALASFFGLVLVACSFVLYVIFGA